MMRFCTCAVPALRRAVLLAGMGLATTQLLPAQQFRAAWADVFHVGMGSASEVDTMVSKLVAGRYNAVIVQVLAYMDANGTASHGAHWKSSILPWSTRVKSNFDPLDYLCQQAHANGIEVHAWLGGSGAAMYRVSTAWPPAGNSTLAAHPEWMMVPQANSEGNAVVAINGYYMLDMGSSDAQEYIVSIVRELVTNYPIDGIHWDDEHGSAEYSAGLGFPAYSAVTYPRSGLARYRANTGYVGTPSATDAAYGDYRRRFKNELIARCQAEIQSIKTNPRQPLRHTAAVMAYGGPPSTCNFTTEEAYTYYSDWPTMLQNGWLDAAIPMNYKTSANDSLYRAWCDRAYACWRYSRHIYMGAGAYLNPMSYTVSQLQYAYTGQSGGNGFNGGVTYSYGVPTTDAGDWWSYCAANLYTNSATTPAMPWRNPATATEGLMWGRVRDASAGNYVDDATVTVSGRPAVRTDGNGYYVATLIPATPGGTVYSVTASRPGFAPQTVVNATVLAGDIVRYDLFLNPPAAPTDLSASAVSGTQINLAWTDNATNETGYLIARGTVSGGPYTNIGGVGANVTNYPDTGLTTNTTYYYVVRAVNAYTTSANSAQASATTFAPPAILSQPQDQTVVAGQNASFSVTATGTGPLSYQWRFNSTNLAGATASSYTRTNAQPAHAGHYSVVVTNAAGAVTSSNALLTVNVPPAITAQPQSVTTNVGATVTFSVIATGTEPLSYQWRFNATNLAGATASVYSLTNVQSAHAGNYSVMVSNVADMVVSDDAVLTVLAPPPPRFDAITHLPDGRVRLTVRGDPGNYAIDRTLDLFATPGGWTELTNFVVNTNSFDYTDPQADLPQRFYRARRLLP
jgi:uncharacterized lipoprotein YddW (UPF0748 family)